MERAQQARPPTVPDPSGELWLIAGLIVEMSRGKPDRVDRMLERMEAFVAGQADLAKVVRIRAPEQDLANQAAMLQALEWLRRVRPVLKLLAQ